MLWKTARSSIPRPNTTIRLPTSASGPTRFSRSSSPRFRSGNHPGYTGGPPITGLRHRNAAFGLSASYGVHGVRWNGCDPNLVTTRGIRRHKGQSPIGRTPNGLRVTRPTTDLKAFSAQFGLPAPNANNFEEGLRQWSTGRRPSGSGWDLEAFARQSNGPHGHEHPRPRSSWSRRYSNSDTDLFYAVGRGCGPWCRRRPGGEVSMSWGGSEYSGETSYDSTFHRLLQCVFLRLVGRRVGGTEYPCVFAQMCVRRGTAHSRNAHYPGLFRSSSRGPTPVRAPALTKRTVLSEARSAIRPAWVSGRPRPIADPEKRGLGLQLHL